MKILGLLLKYFGVLASLPSLAGTGYFGLQALHNRFFVPPPTPYVRSQTDSDLIKVADATLEAATNAGQALSSFGNAIIEMLAVYSLASLAISIGIFYLGRWLTIRYSNQ